MNNDYEVTFKIHISQMTSIFFLISFFRFSHFKILYFLLIRKICFFFVDKKSVKNYYNTKVYDLTRKSQSIWKEGNRRENRFRSVIFFFFCCDIENFHSTTIRLLKNYQF